MAAITSQSRGSRYELAFSSPVMDPRKGATEKSLMRHQSQPGKARADATEYGKPSTDGRKRRSYDSGSDSSTASSEGFHNEDFRAGGPYLCSLPVRTLLVPISHINHDQLFRATFRAHEIFKNHDIQTQSLGAFQRVSIANPESQPILTLLASARRECVDDMWITAAKEVYEWLKTCNLSHVSVEILDPRAIKPPCLWPILRDDEIFSMWNSKILPQILELDLSGVSSISCCRRGFTKDLSDSTSTISFSVCDRIDNPRDWKNLRDMVCQVLDKNNIKDVAVIIFNIPSLKMLLKKSNMASIPPV
ncbi:hypothetical protein N7528_008475 [Penicillium herquei]|nr:hypothetical protein N7528_008475 [Penicillium herquei]